MKSFSKAPPPRLSLGSLLAMILSIASVVGSLGGRWLMGLGMAMMAVALGFLGVLSSLRPGVRGGLTGILAIVLGAIGVIIALLAMFFKIVLYTLF